MERTPDAPVEIEEEEEQEERETPAQQIEDPEVVLEWLAPGSWEARTRCV